MIHPENDHNPEISFLFPDEIIRVQARKISQLQKECDKLYQDREALISTLATILVFLAVVALIWLIGPIGQ